jgi:hypothetical protein
MRPPGASGAKLTFTVQELPAETVPAGCRGAHAIWANVDVAEGAVFKQPVVEDVGHVEIAARIQGDSRRFAQAVGADAAFIGSVGGEAAALSVNPRGCGAAEGIEQYAAVTVFGYVEVAAAVKR